uniref:Uncharacterized protein n=1 Tax=Capra hircus TaxID=9925 RepID=A0A8C2NUX0_CAPHI
MRILHVNGFNGELYNP